LAQVWLVWLLLADYQLLVVKYVSLTLAMKLVGEFELIKWMAFYSIGASSYTTLHTPKESAFWI
jgi:hypothetical protein